MNAGPRPGTAINKHIDRRTTQKTLARPAGDPVLLAFLKGRIDGNLAVLNKRLAGRSFMFGERPTIGDISLVGYLYDPADEFGFDFPGTCPDIAKRLDRRQGPPRLGSIPTN